MTEGLILETTSRIYLYVYLEDEVNVDGIQSLTAKEHS